MSQRRVEIQGTLHPDGSLILDEKPGLPAGRVKVLVQTIDSEATNQDAWAALQPIWAERKRRSAPSRSAKSGKSISKLWSDFRNDTRLSRFTGLTVEVLP